MTILTPAQSWAYGVNVTEESVARIGVRKYQAQKRHSSAFFHARDLWWAARGGLVPAGPWCSVRQPAQPATLSIGVEGGGFQQAPGGMS